MTDEYLVWNSFQGTLERGRIETVEVGKHGRRKARLAGGHGQQMGWFSYDALVTTGKAESQGIEVYTDERWETDQERAFERFKNLKVATWPSGTADSRKELGLPSTGGLTREQIEAAYRDAAKRSAEFDSGTLRSAVSPASSLRGGRWCRRRLSTMSQGLKRSGLF